MRLFIVFLVLGSGVLVVSVVRLVLVSWSWWWWWRWWSWWSSWSCPPRHGAWSCPVCAGITLFIIISGQSDEPNHANSNRWRREAPAGLSLARLAKRQGPPGVGLKNGDTPGCQLKVARFEIDAQEFKPKRATLLHLLPFQLASCRELGSMRENR